MASAELDRARAELDALLEAVREGASALRKARKEAARWAARWSAARTRLEELVAARIDALDTEAGELIETELELRASERELTMGERLDLARELEDTMPAVVKLNTRRSELETLLEELDWDLSELEAADFDELADVILEGFTAEGARLRGTTLRALARELARE